MKRVILGAGWRNRYQDKFMLRRKDPEMLKLLDDVIEDIPETSPNIKYLHANQATWLKLLQNTFVRPDCCRYAAFISLMLDAFGIDDYQVYEGYSSPPDMRTVDHEEMLKSANPIVNHVWLICQGKLFEAFNDHVDISGHNAVAKIYPLT